MTSKVVLSLMTVAIMGACNGPASDHPKQETPKAFEDKTSSTDFVSKRGYEDLVESLYQELITKNTDLKKLEDKIDELNKSKSDTLNAFNQFNEKNQSYFGSVNTYVANIQDSLLKEKIRSMVDFSRTKYEASIAGHNELLKIMERKNITISDLHNVLKVVKTLPLIAQYQQNNLPSTTPLEGYIKKQNEAVALADTLTKK